MLMNQEERLKKAQTLAGKVLRLAKDELLVHLRFLDTALSALTLVEEKSINGMATDGEHLYYDTFYVLKKYQDEPAFLPRMYLHILLHCIFYHSFGYGRVEPLYWDMATDIAVENTIIEMKLHNVTLKQDGVLENKLRILKEDVGALTAEKIYRYFLANPPSKREIEEYEIYYKKDEHRYWQEAEEMAISVEQWKKISERVKADLKSFSKGKNNSESLEKNLAEATKDRYDYSDILRRFTVMGENVQVNDDEFDYIYYTYGLHHYGNLPLVEPLEYKDVNKVREFVIAIDTSASCRGSVVKAFLRKTYSILKSSENFFHQVNVHIIQCDSQVQNDTKITNDEEFERFIQYGKLYGMGATDFRPVFEHVDELRRNKEFSNLKGLIYFTDGYGVFPERMPDYDVIFAFLSEDDSRPPLPPWAIKVILEDEEDIVAAQNNSRTASTEKNGGKHEH